MYTVVSSSGSPAVRVFNSDFKLLSTSESGVIFFFDQLLAVELAPLLDRLATRPTH